MQGTQIWALKTVYTSRLSTENLNVCNHRIYNFHVLESLNLDFAQFEGGEGGKGVNYPINFTRSWLRQKSAYLDLPSHNNRLRPLLMATHHRLHVSVSVPTHRFIYTYMYILIHISYT